MNRILILLAGVICFSLAAFIAHQSASKPTEEELERTAAEMQHGEIRWLDKVVVVQGTAVPNLNDPEKPKEQILRESERAAEADALRKALEVIKGVQITSEGTAGETTLSNPQVLMRVQGMLRGFKRLKTKYYKDLGVDMVIAVSLDGPMGDMLVPKSSEKKKEIPKGENKKYSSLIIDATGVPFQPALAPVVKDEAGAPVFYAALVDENAFRKHGAVGYSDSLENAKKDERAGKNPLVVKAKGVDKEKKSDLLIATSDAKPLTEKEFDASYLSEGKVIIVLDPKLAVEKEGN